MKVGDFLRQTSMVNAMHIAEGMVGVYYITDAGKVAVSPSVVQPSGMSRKPMHYRAGYWCAVDHTGRIVDGVFPPPKVRKPVPDTPYEGSWAHEMALAKRGRGGTPDGSTE